MGRKYRTTIYKKASENIQRRRKEAAEIINKSRVLDTEITMLKMLIVIVVVMLIMAPFIIMWRKKHSPKVEGGGSGGIGTGIGNITSTTDTSKSEADRIVNEAGSILTGSMVSSVAPTQMGSTSQLMANNMVNSAANVAANAVNSAINKNMFNHV